MAGEIISRAEARAQGLKRYFTGKPCKLGHVAERLVSGTHCVDCKREKERQFEHRDRAFALGSYSGDIRARTRQEAINLGVKRYYTGKPCPHGHIAERRTVDCRCTDCAAIHANRIGKRWEKNNPERYKEKVRKYREKNKDAISERRQIYRQKNKPKIKDYQKQWRENNPDYDHRKLWKSRSPEFRYNHLRERREKRKAEDPLAYKLTAVQHQAKRRAQQISAGETVSKEELIAILGAQKHRCIYCRADLRKAKKHLDHIMPLALGGKHVRGNLQWLCSSCNLKKQAKDPILFAQKQGRLL